MARPRRRRRLSPHRRPPINRNRRRLSRLCHLLPWRPPARRPRPWRQQPLARRLQRKWPLLCRRRRRVFRPKHPSGGKPRRRSLRKRCNLRRHLLHRKAKKRRRRRMHRPLLPPLRVKCRNDRPRVMRTGQRPLRKAAPGRRRVRSGADKVRGRRAKGSNGPNAGRAPPRVRRGNVPSAAPVPIAARKLTALNVTIVVPDRTGAIMLHPPTGEGGRIARPPRPASSGGALVPITPRAQVRAPRRLRLSLKAGSRPGMRNLVHPASARPRRQPPNKLMNSAGKAPGAPAGLT